MKNYLILLSFILFGCGLSDIDRPGPPLSFLWKKDGYTIRMNEIALEECGLSKVRNKSSLSVESYINLRTQMEQCMLNKGFKYADGGWREFDPNNTFSKRKNCDAEVNKKYPGCSSLMYMGSEKHD